MASILRQIIASPRVRHPEAGLDLCYVTDNIIATSGPSATYPKRAYRNPLDQLVKFLDRNHKEDWAIWEFRAEGTGYPDSEVYGRVFHFPWPDHHPPPFALIPNIMASMRNWLREKEGRVAVVHCKAGKGRSGTASCSYLISEEGWDREEAMQRFTERRMKPGFGVGVSIPSQVRWLEYVSRWTAGGKTYVEKKAEVLEVRVWGLRDGVKIAVEGFVDEGKTIKIFHDFRRDEMEIVAGQITKGGGLADVVSEVMWGHKKESSAEDSDGADQKQSQPQSGSKRSEGAEVIFRPKKPIILPTSDINIDFERRNNSAYGLKLVTSIAHVWFNAFFEGKGPEQGGIADESGVFELEWGKLDGIKGNKRKGIPAFDKFAIKWRTVQDEANPPSVIHEPAVGEEVKQTQPADWRGNEETSPSGGRKDLGLIRNSESDSTSEGDDNTRGRKRSPIIATSAADDQDLDGVRAHGPRGEQMVHPHGGSGSEHETDTEATRTLHGKAASDGKASESKIQAVDGVQEQPPPQDPHLFDNLKTDTGHTLGHIKLASHTTSSS